jgi:hypothetical protein
VGNDGSRNVDNSAREQIAHWVVETFHPLSLDADDESE